MLPAIPIGYEDALRVIEAIRLIADFVHREDSAAKRDGLVVLAALKLRAEISQRGNSASHPTSMADVDDCHTKVKDLVVHLNAYLNRLASPPSQGQPDHRDLVRHESTGQAYSLEFRPFRHTDRDAIALVWWPEDRTRTSCRLGRVPGDPVPSDGMLLDPAASLTDLSAITARTAHAMLSVPASAWLANALSVELDRACAQVLKGAHSDVDRAADYFQQVKTCLHMAFAWILAVCGNKGFAIANWDAVGKPYYGQFVGTSPVIRFFVKPPGSDYEQTAQLAIDLHDDATREDHPIAALCLFEEHLSDIEEDYPGFLRCVTSGFGILGFFTERNSARSPKPTVVVHESATNGLRFADPTHWMTIHMVLDIFRRLCEKWLVRNEGNNSPLAQKQRALVERLLREMRLDGRFVVETTVSAMTPNKPV